MKIPTALVFSCVVCASLAYDPNELEQSGLDCIKSAVTKAGKLQVDCKPDAQPAEFDGLNILQGESKSPDKFNRATFAVGGTCKSQAGIDCAKKLLASHCGSKTTKSSLQENVDELVKLVTPKELTCAAKYVLSKLEQTALECITYAVQTMREHARIVKVQCDSNGKFKKLLAEVVVDGIIRDKTVRFKEGDQCTSNRLYNNAFGCAELLMQQHACGFQTTNTNRVHNSLNGGVQELTAKIASAVDKQVCQTGMFAF